MGVNFIYIYYVVEYNLIFIQKARIKMATKGLFMKNLSVVQFLAIFMNVVLLLGLPFSVQAQPAIDFSNKTADEYKNKSDLYMTRSVVNWDTTLTSGPTLNEKGRKILHNKILEVIDNLTSAGELSLQQQKEFKQLLAQDVKLVDINPEGKNLAYQTGIAALIGAGTSVGLLLALKTLNTPFAILWLIPGFLFVRQSLRVDSLSKANKIERKGQLNTRHFETALRLWHVLHLVQNFVNKGKWSEQQFVAIKEALQTRFGTIPSTPDRIPTLKENVAVVGGFGAGLVSPVIPVLLYKHAILNHGAKLLGKSSIGLLLAASVGTMTKERNIHATMAKEPLYIELVSADEVDWLVHGW